jgi:hypothetical protein
MCTVVYVCARVSVPGHYTALRASTLSINCLSIDISTAEVDFQPTEEQNKLSLICHLLVVSIAFLLVSFGL